MPVPTGNLEDDSSELGTLRSALTAIDADASRLAQIIVVECLDGPATGVINSTCDVPSNYVLIGGGAEDRWVGWPNGAGALLTESRPLDVNNAGSGVRWVTSSKDHNILNTHSLRSWAVGLIVASLTRSQLKARIDYRANTGVSANHAISSCTSPAGMRLIGGGARANSLQQLLVHSFPNANRWNAKSKDHNRASPGTITSFCISTDVPLIIQHRSRSASTTSGLLQASGTVSSSLVPSCFGARSTFSDRGRLLWSMAPVQTNERTPFRDFFAGSKDHQNVDSGTLEAWVTEIGF
jgi:hypothetical protein